MRTEKDTVLIVVDMQNDFTTGSLGSEEAVKIIPVVKQILLDYIEYGIPKDQIIFTQDTHQNDYMNTFEGEHLPIPHCIKGRNGWNIISELTPIAKDGCIILEKPTFGSLTLIQTIKPNTKKIVLIGLCTDVCVISNAILLRTMFPHTEIVIYENACAGVTKASHFAALLTAKSCQITVETYPMKGESV